MGGVQAGAARPAGSMVGRDRELARVTTLLDGALAGHGCLVLCTGEAGIGKTRLAEEVAALAAARGVPVTWARAADRGSLPPYGLWRLVLDGPAVRGGSTGGVRQDLWSRVFGDAKRQALADGADSSSAQRFALFAMSGAGADDDGLVVTSVWQSQAHKDRYEAEHLLPVFQSLGLAEQMMANAEFTEYEAEEAYVR